MPDISNYNTSETLATGFVRPKVTALFFDKLWIPESLLQTTYEFCIPEQVLIKERNELLVGGGDVKAGLYCRKGMLRNAGIDPGHLYGLALAMNKFDSSLVPYNDEKYKIKYKYSKNRNHAIMISAESFYREYGLRISPIYHNLTEFERDLGVLDSQEIYESNSFRSCSKKSNPLLNKDALAICIQDFPSIVEEELSWEQVLDIRADKKRTNQLRRFITWANRTFDNKSPDEIQEILSSELDEYKEALKEHGIKTVIGSFSTIVSSISSVASLISKTQQPLLPILSITAVSLSYLVDTYFSNLKNTNGPIAYLYDIEEGRI